MNSGVRLRDTVFVRTGEPLVVKDRNRDNGQLVLDQNMETFQTENRHGLVNGLSPEDRELFLKILDKAKEKGENPEGRIQEIQTYLDMMDGDVETLALQKYLKSEMVHLMNTFNIKPKEYSVHGSRVR